jgi:hypothetical protein
VSDPAELTHRVLLRVADFLHKLPADQLAELADGGARLAVVRKGARVVSTTRAAAKPPPVTAEQVRAELAAIGDRGAGRRWLADQGLTVPQLRDLARQLGIALPAKVRKDDALDQVGQSVIGRRLDFETLSRPAPPRY